MQLENYDRKSPLKGVIKDKQKKLPFLESAINFSPKKKELNDDLQNFSIAQVDCVDPKMKYKRKSNVFQSTNSSFFERGI